MPGQKDCDIWLTSEYMEGLGLALYHRKVLHITQTSSGFQTQYLFLFNKTGIRKCNNQEHDMLPCHTMHLTGIPRALHVPPTSSHFGLDFPGLSAKRKCPKRFGYLILMPNNVTFKKTLHQVYQREAFLTFHNLTKPRAANLSILADVVVKHQRLAITPSFVDCSVSIKFHLVVSWETAVKACVKRIVDRIPSMDTCSKRCQ